MKYGFQWSSGLKFKLWFRLDSGSQYSNDPVLRPVLFGTVPVPEFQTVCYCYIIDCHVCLWEISKLIGVHCGTVISTISKRHETITSWMQVLQGMMDEGVVYNTELTQRILILLFIRSCCGFHCDSNICTAYIAVRFLSFHRFWWL